MNNIGYEILHKRYSTPIEGENDFVKFIRSMYLFKLEEAHNINKSVDSWIDRMPEGETKNWSKVSQVTPVPIGFGYASLNIKPQPLFEEAIEIAQFISSLKAFHFHDCPYFLTSDGSYENRYYCAVSVCRGQMPSLTKEEIEWAKEDIKSRAKYFKYNLYHNVFGMYRDDGRGGYKTMLCVSCCSVPRRNFKHMGVKSGFDNSLKNIS